MSNKELTDVIRRHAEELIRISKEMKTALNKEELNRYLKEKK